MGSIQAFGVTDRINAGDIVVAAAATRDTRAVKKQFAAFAAQHRNFCTAHKKIDDAESKLHAVRDRIASLDVLQDLAIDRLVVALIGDGLPRLNAFAPFRAPAPSALKQMGDIAEAKESLALVKNIKQRKGLSKATLAATAAVEKIAKEIQSVAAPIAKLEADVATALKFRKGYAQSWSNAFAALKHAALAAEDDGARGLYDTLFVRVASKPAKKKSAKAKPGGETAPSTK